MLNEDEYVLWEGKYISTTEQREMDSKTICRYGGNTLESTSKTNTWKKTPDTLKVIYELKRKPMQHRRKKWKK